MTGGFFKKSVIYIREIVFGLEDSLVSTLGAVTGIAAGTHDGQMAVFSGLVLVVVEAVSMAAGSYLSSKSAREVFESRLKQDSSRLLREPAADDYTIREALKQQAFTNKQIEQIIKALKRERALWMREVQRCEHKLLPAVSASPFFSGVAMGLFYLFGGSVPLLPYLLFPLETAMYISLFATGAGLFLLGVVKSKVVLGHHPIKSGFEMTSVALSAALIGYLVGRLVSAAFGINV